MKIRLTQSGFENYTGQMGVIMFENGLSTADVSPNDAKRIAAVMGANWENGDSANMDDHYMRNLHTPAPNEQEQRELGHAQATKASLLSTASAPVTPGLKVLNAQTSVYTAEQLAALADEKGITGLREVAKEFGIKGNSIGALIERIMEKMPAPEVADASKQSDPASNQDNAPAASDENKSAETGQDQTDNLPTETPAAASAEENVG